MRKYIILFFSVLLFLFACNWSAAPSGIIKQDQMIKILTDIHIVDGSVANKQLIQDTLYKYGMPKYLAVFKKYDTDSVQFKKSLKYYSTKVDKLLAIYQQVYKNIQVKSDSVNKLVAKNYKRIADSTSKAQAKKQQHIDDSLKKVSPKKLKADSLKRLKADKKKGITTKPVLYNKPVAMRHAVSGK